MNSSQQLVQESGAKSLHQEGGRARAKCNGSEDAVTRNYQKSCCLSQETAIGEAQFMEEQGKIMGVDKRKTTEGGGYKGGEPKQISSRTRCVVNPLQKNKAAVSHCGRGV